MSDPTIDRIRSALERSDEELAAELPELIEETRGRTRELVEEYPAVFGRIVDRMESLDIAAFVAENPETADQFQELLWTGTEVLVDNSPDVREQINQDVTVNFEATDCPMTGHLEVDGDAGTITGGAGQLADPTLEITGPADVLVGLMTGNVDPVQGFMSQRYEMEGPLRKGTQLAPLMNSLSENIPSTG